MKEMYSAIWGYRHFIVSSIRNDLRSRFIRSKLGATWMILQPLALVAIYSLVLSRIMSSKLPGISSPYAYSIYLLAGMQAWSLFSEIIMRSLTVFVDNAGLLKKIVFPRVCLPLITVGSALFNNIIMFFVMIIVLALLGHYPVDELWWMPILILVTCAFSIGLGLLMGILNVFVRDVAQFMNVVLQLWFWTTPIVYMTSILSPKLQFYMHINPMYWVVLAYQQVLVFGHAPDLTGLGVVMGASMLLLALSLFLFRRAAPDMVDVL